MTNLIFDLNNIAHRSLFIVGGYGNKAYTFDSQYEIDQLIRKITMDVSYIIRLINPSRVIFALDSKSWRREIKIEENEGYKAQRTKALHINWDNVYTALSDFSDIMSEKGMIVSKIENAEADDVLCLWSNELAVNQKQHVIIVSGDEDLRQLVDYVAANHTFITVFNPFMQGKNAYRKLYVNEFFNDWMNTFDQVDIFNMKGSINLDKEDFKKIITAEKTRVEVVNGRMIGLRKMFCGDDGDNIPAIHTWLNEKEVEVRVTNSKFEKIYELLLNSPQETIIYSDIIDRAPAVLEALKKVTKQKFDFDIRKRLIRQAKLVILNKNLFPTEIVNEFEKNKIKDLEKPRINYANINMYNLLEGTRYVKDRKIENEAPIFREIDRIKGSSLF